MNSLKKKGYFWATLGLFIFSLVMHWVFAWSAYKSDQETHHAPAKVSEYVIITVRDTMENWQSEFLQLIWQVVGLSFLFYAGSPADKIGDNRKEEKMDLIIRRLYPEEAGELLENLSRKYPKG